MWTENLNLEVKLIGRSGRKRRIICTVDLDEQIDMLDR